MNIVDRNFVRPRRFVAAKQICVSVNILNGELSNLMLRRFQNYLIHIDLMMNPVRSNIMGRSFG
ncbi:hypothetical protein BH10BDE1_BH10BDE1_07970 [soil metagenome]